MGALHALINSLFSTRTLTFGARLGRRKGRKEEGKEAPSGQGLGWDRIGVATRALEAVCDAKMWKSLALPPWRKEPKTEV